MMTWRHGIGLPCRPGTVDSGASPSSPLSSKCEDGDESKRELQGKMFTVPWQHKASQHHCSGECAKVYLRLPLLLGLHSTSMIVTDAVMCAICPCLLFWWEGCTACGMLAPNQGFKPLPLAWAGNRVLTTGPPGDSLFLFLNNNISSFLKTDFKHSHNKKYRN